MKCKICNTQMLIDEAREDAEKNIETLHYKCPNPGCSNYGYGGKKEKEGGA